MPKFLKKIPLSGWWFDKFKESYAILAVDRQFGNKKRKRAGVNLGNRGPQNRFLIAMAKPDA